MKDGKTVSISTSALIEVAGDRQESGSWYCDQLERGKVLFFAGVPFNLPEADRDFLLSQKQSSSNFHKNISYRPASDILKGVSSESPDCERLHAIMRSFSREMTRFVSSLLVPYAGKLKLDFASFRPLEEHGRKLPLHKRNDLIHVDAFPTRPTHGGRILRAFASQQQLVFPPGSTWLVYTDGVPHAVISGQYALEQTYIVPLEALVSAEVAPVRVLESLTGSRMTN
jgi:hypothetical protein